MKVAALYVATNGVYFNLPNVEPYDVKRDARLYDGPWPVVAHPPCERWGRYWFGGPSARERRVKGDDGGCFAHAIGAVRKFGGVLEHPEGSAAWPAFQLAAPPKRGGWVRADDVGGWTCCVEQGHYGHRARKATWLYLCGVEPPSLRWGPSAAQARVDGAGFHTAAERERALAGGMTRREWLRNKGIVVERMGKRERTATPLPFRDLLLSIARGGADAA
jgi:hypothetical protein